VKTEKFKATTVGQLCIILQMRDIVDLDVMFLEAFGNNEIRITESGVKPLALAMGI
jgi:hypothetical protein